MRRWRVWVLGALLAWILLSAWWALQPVTDTVDTGLVKNVETSQAVQCDSPLSGNTKPTEPLPALHGGRKYEYTPCESVVQNSRTIFWVDVALVLIAVVVLAKTWKPAADSDSDSREDVSAA
jgi:hypothetical protein